MLNTQLRLAAFAAILACSNVLAHPVTAPAASSVASASSFKTSDGVMLAHTVAGKGMPSLFIHGGPGSGSEIVERLAGSTLEQHFHMVYLDQRGSGRSGSDPKKNYSLDRVIADMEELRESLKIKQWVLMSHSFGGIIATAYARKHPERISGMVLLNSILHLPASMESTAKHGYELLPAATRPPMDPAMPLPQRFGMVMGMLGQANLSGKLMYSEAGTEARVNAALKPLPANRDFATTLFTTGAIMNYVDDMAPATAKLAMPVLVISGKEDHMVGVDHYKSFQFPNQTVALVPGKHFAMLEQPAEVGKALGAFAKSLPSRQ